MMNDKGRKVDAMLIGAGRSGTTSFCSALEQHPDVCFSTIKEVNYFSIDELFQRGEGYFHSFFEAQEEKVLITSDTYLLPAEAAIERIWEYNPRMKLIVLLRDPVQRAYSSYNYSVNYGHHEAYLSFLESIEKEKGLKDCTNLVDLNNLGHFYGSLYAKHLQRWMKVFPREQFLFLHTSDLKDKMEGLSKEISSFLSIAYQPLSFEQQNKNAVPKSVLMERLFINRGSWFRRSLRYVLPGFIKQSLFKSGIVEQVKQVNRSAMTAEPLCEEDYIKALAYFEEDMKDLKKVLGD